MRRRSKNKNTSKNKNKNAADKAKLTQIYTQKKKEENTVRKRK